MVETLIFVRHGQSEANVTRTISNRDLPHSLTELGKDQALNLAETLAMREVQIIYSSPILRARETADIVAGACGIEVTVADELREFDCGVMEGRGDDEAWQAHNLASTRLGKW